MKVIKTSENRHPPTALWEAAKAKTTSWRRLQEEGEVYFRLRDGALRIFTDKSDPKPNVVFVVISHTEGISEDSLAAWGAIDKLDFTSDEVRDLINGKCNCPDCKNNDEEGECENGI